MSVEFNTPAPAAVGFNFMSLPPEIRSKIIKHHLETRCYCRQRDDPSTIHYINLDVVRRAALVNEEFMMEALRALETIRRTLPTGRLPYRKGTQDVDIMTGATDTEGSDFELIDFESQRPVARGRRTLCMYYAKWPMLRTEYHDCAALLADVMSLERHVNPHNVLPHSDIKLLLSSELLSGDSHLESFTAIKQLAQRMECLHRKPCRHTKNDSGKG